jgi:UDP-glucose:(heptosyl)LPS alpha-1,3-glucosyltransferase
VRIAFIRQKYTPYGGAERFVDRAAASLIEAGASITVIARQWRVNEQGIVPRHRRCNPYYIGRIWRDWGFASKACRLIAKRSYDLVQSHERIACCDVYRAGDGVHRQWLKHRARGQSWLAAKLTRFNPYNWYVLRAERRLFASDRLRAVICNSEMVKADIIRHFPQIADKLHVIYNGVDLEMFNPSLRETERAAKRVDLGVGAGQKLYLYVGSGFERKGVRTLLEGFEKQGNERDRLVIVGEDKHMESMKRLARELGLAERVKFVGGQLDVRAYYAAADCFVLPTLYDPFPNAVIEAMACGLPVITTAQTGASELITQGVNGFVVDALDATALAEAMRRFRGLDVDASSAAARAAVASLALEAKAAELIELYRKLLDSNALLTVSPASLPGAARTS